MINKGINASFRLACQGGKYLVNVESVRYSDSLIINKVKIGYADYWFIFQNRVWLFTGMMPLCKPLKKAVTKSLSACYGLSSGSATIMPFEQNPLALEILFKAVALK